MKILKIVFVIIWLLFCFAGITKNYSHYDGFDWILIILLTFIPCLIIWFFHKKETIKNKNKTPIPIKKILGVIFLIEFVMSVCFSFTLWKDEIFPSILVCLIWGIDALLLLKKPKTIIQQTSESARLNKPIYTDRNRKKKKHIVVSMVIISIFTGIFISAVVAYNKNPNNNHLDNISPNISETETVPTFFQDSSPTETLAESQADIEVESSYAIQTSTDSDNSPMVWISFTGKKYHKKSTCSNMKGSSQVSLKRAISMGRDACKKCYK